MRIVLVMLVLLHMGVGAMASGNGDNQLQGVAPPPYVQELRGSENSVPYDDLAWGFFVFVKGLNSQPPLLAQPFLESTVGIEPEEATKLIQHIYSAVNDFDASMRSQITARCTGDQLQTLADRRSVASDMKEAKRQSDSVRRRLIRDVEKILSPSSRILVDTWIDEHIRPGFILLEIDYDSYVEAEEVEPESYKSRVCQHGKNG